jgi:hypothetical protein
VLLGPEVNHPFVQCKRQDCLKQAAQIRQ